MKPLLPLTMLAIGTAVGWFGRPLATGYSDHSSEAAPAKAASAHASDAKSPADPAGKPADRTSSGRPAIPDNEEASVQKEVSEAAKNGRELMAKRMTDIQRRKFDARMEKLTANLNLTPEQQAQVRAGMEKRFEKLGGLLASSFDSESRADKMKSLATLTEEDGLDEATANILTAEQKKGYTEFKGKERQNRVEAQALKDLGNITTTLELSPEQRDGVYQVLSEEATKREDNPKPSGVMKFFAESQGIQFDDELGVQDLVQEQMEAGISSDTSSSSPADMQKKLREAVQQRVIQRIDALRPHLNESQIRQYQTHLEAKTVGMLNSLGGGGDEPDATEDEAK